MPVKRLLQELTAKEIEEWREFERIEPFGYLADEARFAALRAQIRNMMATKEDIPLMPIDFMPDHPDLEKAKEERNQMLITPTQSVDEMRQVILMIHGAGEDK